jgi:hypothetical protein
VREGVNRMRRHRDVENKTVQVLNCGGKKNSVGRGMYWWRECCVCMDFDFGKWIDGICSDALLISLGDDGNIYIVFLTTKKL